jgi:hypothetical protein
VIALAAKGGCCHCWGTTLEMSSCILFHRPPHYIIIFLGPYYSILVPPVSLRSLISLPPYLNFKVARRITIPKFLVKGGRIHHTFFTQCNQSRDENPPRAPFTKAAARPPLWQFFQTNSSLQGRVRLVLPAVCLYGSVNRQFEFS